MEDNTKGTIEFFNYIRLSRLISRCGHQILRQLFRARYKLLTHTEWENGDESHSPDFIQKYGSDLKLSSEQRTALDSADIYKWDFTLLANVLVKMDLAAVGSEYIKERVSEEITGIKELRAVRNYVEHLPSQSISEVDYVHWWDKARDVLIQFGANESEIEYIRTTSRLDGLKFQSTTIDKENLKKAQGLRKQGNQLVKEGRQEKGIELYNQAVILFGLTNNEMSYLFSRRSEAYLGLLEADSDLPEDLQEHYMETSMEDARACTQLRPTWWKGHYLTGKVYQRRKVWIDAIDAFENALSSNPHSQDVINARDECRYDNEHDIINHHLDPLRQPRSHCETKKYFEQTRRRNYVHNMKRSKMEVKMAEKMIESKNVKAVSIASVFMAHRYLHGDMKPLDVWKAAELFKKAADMGSPEGAYNIGKLYMEGTGVQRNIPEGVRLIEEAANYQIKDDDPLYNLGIDAGKFAVARCYAQGVGKPRNYILAADWYRRAALEGCANACNNLANMYENGTGIKHDFKRALQYHRLAIELNCPIVMDILAYRYMELGDLSKAQYWFDRAVESGYTYSMMKEPEFKQLLQERLDELEEFKSKLPSHVLDSGIPLHVLENRYRRRACPELYRLNQIYFESLNPQPAKSGRFFSKLLACVDDLQAWAYQGHEYAKILLSALWNLTEGLEILRHLLDHKNELGNAQELKEEALTLITSCYTAGVEYMASLPEPCHKLLEDIAHEFLDSEGRSVCDLNARIFLVHQYMTWSEKGNKLTQVCKSLYPDVSHFHVMHTAFLGFLKKYDEGARVCTEGLERFPGHYELLYLRAVHLRLSSHPEERGGREAVVSLAVSLPNEEALDPVFVAAQLVIDAYQDFLDKAPLGHRKVPESYYAMALLSLASQKMERFEDYYLLGVNAENRLLPCFLPYESSSKESAELMYNLYKASKDKESFTKRFDDRFDKLLEEDPDEVEAEWKLQLLNPKRIIVTRVCRRRSAMWVREEVTLKKKQMYTYPNNTEGKHTQKAPSRKQIPLLTEIRFEDMDPTIDRVYEGRFINLTIMEEYVNGPMKSIHSVVKDDNHDFQLIYFYNMDRNDKGLKEKLGFGSRIRIQNPYLRLTEDRSLGLRVDAPRSIQYISSGTENPICRYCWKREPSSIVFYARKPNIAIKSARR